MTTVNITRNFETLRNKAKQTHALDGRHPSSPHDGKNSLLNDNVGDSESMLHANGLETLPPKWVDITTEINDEFSRVDILLKRLDEAFSQRLKVTFGSDDDEAQKQEMIDSITHEVTFVIKNIENKIKQIATIQDEPQTITVLRNGRSIQVPNPNAELSTNEKNIRLNVMRNLGSKLKDKTRGFKQMQRDFLGRLQQQQQVGNDLFAGIALDNGEQQNAAELQFRLETALDQGLNDEQLAALRDIEERSDDREREIIHLAQNINELASLFNELNVLVIEQGTVLDRIDYNVENTLTNVTRGRIELEKAEEMSKANWMLKTMLILFVVIGVELILLLLKWKVQH